MNLFSLIFGLSVVFTLLIAITIVVTAWKEVKLASEETYRMSQRNSPFLKGGDTK